MPRTEYAPEVKAAVLAALLAGQSIGSVAAEYRVPAATVRSWKSRQGGGNAVATVATDKKQRIGELLLEYLTVNLETLIAQTRVFKDEGWLRKQPAESAAVLHGVLADKGIRLLEAFAAEPEPGADGGDGALPG